MALKASFDYYFKACRKGDTEAKAVTVNQSAVRALADASEITQPRAGIVCSGF